MKDLRNFSALTAMDAEALRKELREAHRSLMIWRLQAKNGVAKTHVHRYIRRYIARLETALHQKHKARGQAA